MRVHFTSSLAALAFVSTLSVGSLSLAAPLHSSLFNQKYEGDVVNSSNPNAIVLGPSPSQAATFIDDHVVQGDSPFATAPSTDGNIMSYRAAPGGPRFRSSNWAATHSTGWTIETRLRIDDDFAEASGGAMQLVAGDGVQGDVLRIGQSKVATKTGTVVVSTADNTSDFHTFRVAVSHGVSGHEGDSIRVWRDDVLLATYPSGDFGTNLMFFGSAGGSVGGPSVHVDYYRWDNTGAYEPGVIPEPTSLTLLSLPGFAALLRRR